MIDLFLYLIDIYTCTFICIFTYICIDSIVFYFIDIEQMEYDNTDRFQMFHLLMSSYLYRDILRLMKMLLTQQINIITKRQEYQRIIQ